MTVEHVVGDSTALATVLRQSASPGPGTQSLGTHEPLDAVQPAALTQCEHVAPDTPGAIGSVTSKESLAHMAAQHFVVQASCASRPAQPRIEPASRDTKRLAHQVHRPGPLLLRNELELQSESLAK